MVVPEVIFASFSAEALSVGVFDEFVRGWRVSCSALPGGLHVFSVRVGCGGSRVFLR